MDFPSIVRHLEGLETLKANMASVLPPDVYAELCSRIDEVRDTVTAEIKKTPLPDANQLGDHVPPHLQQALQEMEAIQSGLPTTSQLARQAFVDDNDWSGFGIVRDAVDAPHPELRVQDDRFDFQDWAMTASSIVAPTNTSVETSQPKSPVSDLDLWMNKPKAETPPSADAPPAVSVEPPTKKHSHLDSWLNESES